MGLEPGPEERQEQGPTHPNAGQDRQTQPDRRAETQGTSQTTNINPGLE
jgi:hypothetical protein